MKRLGKPQIRLFFRNSVVSLLIYALILTPAAHALSQSESQQAAANATASAQGGASHPGAGGANGPRGGPPSEAMTAEAQAEDQLAKQVENAKDLKALDTEYGRVCPDAAGGPKVVGGDSNAVELKKTYCTAAKQAIEAARAADKTWMIHGGVAGVCTYACANSYISGGVSEVAGISSCSAANVTGAVAVGVITKNYMGIITSLGMTMLPKLMGGGDSGKPKFGEVDEATRRKRLERDTKLRGKDLDRAMENQAKDAKEDALRAQKEAKEYHETKETDPASCLTAAMKAFETYQTYQTIQTSVESARSSLLQAAKVRGDRSSAVAAGESPTTDKSPTPLDSPSPEPSASASSESSKSADSSGGSGSGGGGADGLNSDPCQSTDNSYDVATSCALAGSDRAKDSANVTKHDEFQNDFNKITGMSPEDFFNEHQSAASALNSLVSGAMGAATGTNMNSPEGKAAAAKIKDALKELQVEAQSGSPEYSDGSRGGGSPEEEAMEEAMMGRLRSGSKDFSGVDVQSYTGRNPAGKKAIEDDPTVNIFDRVTVRYQILNKRWKLVPR